MDDREIQCPECGAWAPRTPLFQHYGFRLRVPCKCGAMVRTGLELADLPRYRIDFDASSPAQLAAAAPVVTVKRLHPDVPIDEHTPLWSLYGKPKTATHRSSRTL